MTGTLVKPGAPFTDHIPERKGVTHQEKWKAAGFQAGTLGVVAP